MEYPTCRQLVWIMDLISVICTDGTIASITVAMTVLPALIGIFLGCISGNGNVTKLITALCGLSCLAGVFTLPLWYHCSDITIIFGIESAMGPYRILIDQLSALLISVSSLVFLMAVIHMNSSVDGLRNRYLACVNALFIACYLCMCSDSVAVLLMGWEAVSLLTFLMAPKYEDETPRWRFFVITHLGGLMLIGVYAYLTYISGTFVLSEWGGLSSLMGEGVSSLLIFLLFIGFGSKLGLIPFHAWMPDMYGESPAHTVTLLSTVCSNVAVLVLFKSVFGYIGVDSGVYIIAIILVAMSCISALWGAMESMIQNKPKRILAYSSMENMALVMLCMSMAMIFSGVSESLMKLVLVAGLLHTINHSVFKSLMLMTVHTVIKSTNEKDLSAFGGLGRKMPALSFIALIGVASMSAIPPMNGFISEWLMLQSMIAGDASVMMLKLIMPFTVAILGLCGMIAATSYMRLYGFTFLGRSRSKGAESPKPAARTGLMALGVLAALCILFGLFALQFTDLISSGLESFLGLTGPSYKEALSGNFMPFVLTLMLLGTIAILVILSRIKRSEGINADTWSCGSDLDEYMQYSSMGFAQPIVRVFHPIYGDMTEMDMDEHGNRTIYHVKFVEPFVRYLYVPLGKAIMKISEVVGRLQTGNIQSYLGYVLVTLVVSLLLVRLL